MFARAEVAVCAEDAERDGQIETRALFAHIGGRKVDRRLVKREEEGAVVDRSPDAFARFAHGEVGQANDGHGRRRVGFATRGRQVNLDVHEVCVNAIDGGGLGAEEHSSEATD